MVNPAGDSGWCRSQLATAVQAFERPLVAPSMYSVLLSPFCLGEQDWSLIHCKDFSLSGGAKFCPISEHHLLTGRHIDPHSSTEVYTVSTQPELLPFHPVPQREIPLKQQQPQTLQKTNVFPQPDKHIGCCGN